jgi:hypothetical protein
MKLVSVAVIVGIAAAAVIVYRSRHGVEVWHTAEDQPA